MQSITTIGPDIAKSVFQVHGVGPERTCDRDGRCLLIGGEADLAQLRRLGWGGEISVNARH